MKVGSLFAGYDGIGIAVESLWPEAERAWFVEYDAAPSRILDHHWPDTPNLGDITTVDWSAAEPGDPHPHPQNPGKTPGRACHPCSLNG